ncbi:MAG: leucine--tRNA ligase [Caldilineaceae bacterium]
MSHYYDPQAIEAKWQQIWAEQAAFLTPTGAQLQQRPKFYVLDMFPYPSGDGLHVGHPKGYTATDVIARTRRMQGYNVLHPMGWDAFGLPAERAADRKNSHPAIVTEQNIATFRRQLQRMGFSYDWTREINTSAPDYYKWTQWIFLKLFDQGLAYMADVPVNWCPALGTVLSNEEVQDGKYVETGDPVERRLMRQWMLRITTYAERLLDDLNTLDWPESLKQMQRNWIGKSEGALIQFKIGADATATTGANPPPTFEVFTTRPDTLFGATYCVLAPEHPLVQQIVTAAQREAVAAYIAATGAKSERDRLADVREKTGVFTGAYAINPANNQPIPIWVADYVLLGYGTGAIMAVPAHDERDHAFARQFDLPIVAVVSGGEQPITEAAYVGEGVAINSGFLDGLSTAAAKAKMIEWLEAAGQGERQIQYRLRDWLFSRQRYWGEPFPIVHLEDGSIVRLPDEQLPVALPEIIDRKATEFGKPPLSRAADDWLLVTLPDGRVGLRETNTMPQWAGSCWYYLRFIDPHNAKEAWAPAAEEYWMPVDLYVGGVEHAVLHLLYARFWHKVLYDCGLVSTKEPFQQLFNQGLIGAYSYRDANGKYYHRDEVVERNGEWFTRTADLPVQTQLEKMSKSKLNVYSLDEVVEEFGADALRLYELFIGPVSSSIPWNMAGIEGVARFLQRVWRLVIDEERGTVSSRVTATPPASEPALEKLLHKSIKRVTECIATIDKLNRAVSTLMEFVNGAGPAPTLPVAIVKDFLRLLAPFAPHLAEELWATLGEETLIAYATWPTYDEALIVEAEVEAPVQINGKLRTVLTVDAEIDEETLQQVALQDERIQSYVVGKTIRRIIVTPNKLVNIVVAPA